MQRCQQFSKRRSNTMGVLERRSLAEYRLIEVKSSTGLKSHCGYDIRIQKHILSGAAGQSQRTAVWLTSFWRLPYLIVQTGVSIARHGNKAFYRSLHEENRSEASNNCITHD